MSSSTSSFSDALERSVQHRDTQMWQAAQTVRAHVAPDGVAMVLECLGLEDVTPPATRA